MQKFNKLLSMAMCAVRDTLLNFIIWLLHYVIPIDERLALCATAFNGFTDNAKYIYLHLEKIDNFKVVWISPNRSIVKELNDAGHCSNYKWSLGAFFKVLKARYFFITHIHDVYPVCRPDTIIVNLWHGTPIKKMGYDTKVDSAWIKRRSWHLVPHPYKRWNFMCVSNNSQINSFRSAFNLDLNRILVTGLPRNDILFAAVDNEMIKEQLRSKVCEQLRIDKSKKIVLYAPTFRDIVEGKLQFVAKLVELLDYAKEELKGYHLLLRLHPLTECDLTTVGSANIVDASRYSDIQELMVASDFLVTDYSSVIFDYSILRRPIILYPYDIESYMQSRDGFYIDYNSIASNFVVINDVTKLREAMENNLNNTNSRAGTEFYATYNVRNACDTICRETGILQ